MFELFTLIFIALVVAGLVWAYIKYLDEKGEKLKSINQGICPSCKQKSIEMIDQKGGGCSGTAFVEFKCTNCGYSDGFNVGGGSCGSGGCKI
jgi:hypothetical protein